MTGSKIGRAQLRRIADARAAIRHVFVRDLVLDCSIGIHQYEHVDGMITFSKGIMTFYRMDDSDTADSKKSEPNPVVGWGRYQIMPGRRLVLDVEYSNSVNFANKQINFEYEWLDDSRVRYWILKADGNRSNVMGTSKKMN